MARYFGTDGVRGRVGQTPMTPDFVLKLGWALGTVLRRTATRPLVVIGKDTRLSGYMLESALESGLSAAGADVRLLGPMPTPAVAYLSQTFRAQAGVVISASHNPFYDNGVKFFGGNGQKLPDSFEADIEALLDEPLACVESDRLGRARRVDDAAGRYIEFCKSTFRGAGLKGLSMVVDCAHGAAYHVAPKVFRELGADVDVMGADPDGLNINAERGSTHPDALQQRVVELGADLGVALDGDADRCVMVDARGRLVDGDDILYIIARSRQARKRLHGPVVGTVMSNLGLELALRASAIPFERAQVGDRYVLEKLKALGGQLGGESSGHIICLDRTSTGDGTVAALQVLAEMVRTGNALEDLLGGLDKCPQTLINVATPAGVPAAQLLEDERVKAASADVTAVLGSRGRVLLRPSGTEPVVRVMVECEDADLARSSAQRIAAEIEGLAKS